MTHRNPLHDLNLYHDKGCAKKSRGCTGNCRDCRELAKSIMCTGRYPTRAQLESRLGRSLQWLQIVA